ncbi:unnamed protein product [Diamesa tonsa]
MSQKEISAETETVTESQKAEAVENRRVIDEENAKKFNASKQRMFGGDSSPYGNQYIGGDYGQHNRLREQQLQQKHWLDQQIAERKALDLKNKQREQNVDASMFQYTNNSVDRASIRIQDKRSTEKEIGDYNILMAQNKRDEQKKMKQQEKDEEKEHIRAGSSYSRNKNDSNYDQFSSNSRFY